MYRFETASSIQGHNHNQKDVIVALGLVGGIG